MDFDEDIGQICDLIFCQVCKTLWCDYCLDECPTCEESNNKLMAEKLARKNLDKDL